jgi:hypothetical protein
MWFENAGSTLNVKVKMKKTISLCYFLAALGNSALRQHAFWLHHACVVCCSLESLG